MPAKHTVRYELGNLAPSYATAIMRFGVMANRFHAGFVWRLAGETNVQDATRLGGGQEETGRGR